MKMTAKELSEKLYDDTILNQNPENIFSKVQDLTTELLAITKKHKLSSKFDVVYESLTDGTFTMKIKLTNIKKY